MNSLKELDARDRNDLLTISTDRILGWILQLNRQPRYHNMIDAIRLASRLMEIRQRKLADREKHVAH